MTESGDGEPPEDPLARVIELIDASEFEEALAAMADLLHELEPEHAGRAIALEVIALRALGEDEDASARLDSRLGEHAGSAPLLLAIGIELSDREQLDDAERVMRLVCEADAEGEIPRYNLALVLERRGQLDEAVMEYDEALARAPAFAPAAARKAATLRAAGRLTEAAAAYRRYLELEPGDAHEWISLAITESDLAHWAEADAAYARARTLAPDSVTLHFNWAITASRRRDRESLLACVRELERCAAADLRTTLARAYLAEEEHRPREAFDQARVAYELALGSEDPDAGPAAARAALNLARRNGLDEEARRFGDGLFEHESFDEAVLAILRSLGGRRSDRAIDFSVLVEGRHEEPSEERALRYIRSYRVLARDADEACELALAFERRCGGEDLSVRQVERAGAPAPEDLGVSWRLGSKMVFPEDEDEDDATSDDD